MIGVLVMFNNFFHDLAVALLTCAVVGHGALWRSALRLKPEARPLLEALDRAARRTMAVALFFIVAFGIGRTIAFEEYEWIPAAGKNLLPMLAVKHLLLSALLVYGITNALKARKAARVFAAERAS